jgi:hypothetical protein
MKFAQNVNNSNFSCHPFNLIFTNFLYNNNNFNISLYYYVKQILIMWVFFIYFFLNQQNLFIAIAACTTLKLDK